MTAAESTDERTSGLISRVRTRCKRKASLEIRRFLSPRRKERTSVPEEKSDRHRSRGLHYSKGVGVLHSAALLDPRMLTGVKQPSVSSSSTSASIASLLTRRLASPFPEFPLTRRDPVKKSHSPPISIEHDRWLFVCWRSLHGECLILCFRFFPFLGGERREKRLFDLETLNHVYRRLVDSREFLLLVFEHSYGLLKLYSIKCLRVAVSAMCFRTCNRRIGFRILQ